MNEGTVFLLLIQLALAVLGRYPRNRQWLRLQEIAHRERMLSMENGLHVSELPGGDLEPGIARGRVGTTGGARGRARDGVLQRRIAALCCSDACTSEDATIMRVLTGVVVIPLMASFGLLLYYRLTAPNN
jgi:hypothetical protein